MGETTCTDGKALAGASYVAAAPNGIHVYSSAGLGGPGSSQAVAAFARQLPPVCQPGSQTVGPGSTTLNLSCSDPNGDSLARSVTDPPHGTLGTIDESAGTVGFTPDPGYSGADSFLLSATDDSETGPAASFDLTVDQDAPETAITKGPKKRTEKPKAKVKFTADDPGATFECRLAKSKKVESKEFQPCTSPFKQKAKPGKNTVEVRATDQLGNVEDDPAQRKFKLID